MINTERLPLVTFPPHKRTSMLIQRLLEDQQERRAELRNMRATWSKGQDKIGTARMVQRLLEEKIETEKRRKVRLEKDNAGPFAVIGRSQRQKDIAKTTQDIKDAEAVLTTIILSINETVLKLHDNQEHRFSILSKSDRATDLISANKKGGPIVPNARDHARKMTASLAHMDELQAEIKAR